MPRGREYPPIYGSDPLNSGQPTAEPGEALRAFEKEPNFLDYPAIVVVCLGALILPGLLLGLIHLVVEEGAIVLSPTDLKGLIDKLEMQSILQPLATPIVDALKQRAPWLLKLASFGCVIPFLFICFSRCLMSLHAAIRPALSAISLASLGLLYFAACASGPILRAPEALILTTSFAVVTGAAYLCLLSNPDSSRRPAILWVFGGLLIISIVVHAAGSAASPNDQIRSLESLANQSLEQPFKSLFIARESKTLIGQVLAPGMLIGPAIFAAIMWPHLIGRKKVGSALLHYVPVILLIWASIASQGVQIMTGDEFLLWILLGILVGMVLQDRLSRLTGLGSWFLDWNRRLADRADRDWAE